ncbi:hypothetical protein MWM44_15165 [Legionella pneumophila]|nr:hypothetical protein [Legionella pneumophila]
MGGDGTLNHVLNGLIEKDKLKNPQTKIAFFNALLSYMAEAKNLWQSILAIIK